MLFYRMKIEKEYSVMIAVVKSIELIDYESWVYRPDDIENFGIAAEAMIGPIDEEGADIFSFEICTPRWFAKNKLGSAAFARHVVFVPIYDEQAIKHLVVDTVRRTTGNTWGEIAEKLSRYFLWEFEDYKKYAVLSF